MKFQSKKDIFNFFPIFFTKRAITELKKFVSKNKKAFLDRYIRNIKYQFKSCNGQDNPVRQHGRKTGKTKKSGNFLAKIIFCRSPVTL